MCVEQEKHRGLEALEGKEAMETIEMVQRMLDETYQNLLERAEGVRYLEGTLIRAMDWDFAEMKVELEKMLSGVAGLLDSVAGSLDALAHDMEFCDKELGRINLKDKAV
jgi:hypothetical protein